MRHPIRSPGALQCRDQPSQVSPHLARPHTSPSSQSRQLRLLSRPPYQEQIDACTTATRAIVCPFWTSASQNYAAQHGAFINQPFPTACVSFLQHLSVLCAASHAQFDEAAKQSRQGCSQIGTAWRTARPTYPGGRVEAGMPPVREVRVRQKSVLTQPLLDPEWRVRLSLDQLSPPRARSAPKASQFSTQKSSALPPLAPRPAAA